MFYDSIKYFKNTINLNAKLMLKIKANNKAERSRFKKACYKISMLTVMENIYGEIEFCLIDTSIRLI